MNKFGIISTSLLSVAIIVLYILHFTTLKKSDSNDTKSFSSVQSGNIVYINIDSLLNHYDMYFELRKQLTDKQKRMEAEFGSKSKSYEVRVADFQEKVQKGLVTRSRAQEMEQEIMIEQQNILKLRDQMTQELAEEEQVMNRQLMYEITEYLKEFNRDGRFQYIMSYAFGGNLLYVPDSLNITSDVLKGLNLNYEAKNKK